MKFSRTVASFIVAMLFVAPLMWLVLGSIQPSGQTAHPLPLLPNPITLSNYWQIFKVYDLGRPFLNSLFVVLMTIPLTIITASGAGFAMSQLSSRLRQRLVLLTVMLMIVPLSALCLPRFVIFSTVCLLDTLA